MAAIRVEQVTKQFGPQIVLAGVTLELNPGEIVGLVGANGCGKTTLLRLLADQFPPDTGNIVRMRSLDIGYLSQEPDIKPKRTLHEEVGSAFEDLLTLETSIHDLSDRIAAAPHGSEQDDLMGKLDRLHARFEVEGGYTFTQRMNEILGGLGFTEADHDLSVSVLSGGQKCRAALAKLLLKDSTYLLLDEPTNHLDIDAVRWLEKFVISHSGGAVVVSHDRYLLDRVADRIVEMDHGRTSSFPGNYSNYAKTREMRLLTRQRRFEEDQSFIEKERAFIAKHLAGQRTKEAQGRRTRLERRLAAGEFETERATESKPVPFKFDHVKVSESAILRVDELAKGFGEKQLFDNVSFQIRAAERFAITGSNGVGKSTLLKIIVGELEADAGSVEFGPKMTIGYYAQDSVELVSDMTVLETVHETCPELTEQKVRSYAGRFRFTGDDVFKPISKLSGGEQSRVRLLKLILSAPNVLVLDEPTNHLDIASREALEESLSVFPGTILAVSHDRYFLDRMADRILVLRPESGIVYNGNYSYYLEQVERKQAIEQADKKKRNPKSAAKKSKPGKKSSHTSEFDSMSVGDIEAYIIEREERVAELNERFASPEVYRDPDKLADLRAQVNSIKAELTVAEECWQERTEE